MWFRGAAPALAWWTRALRPLATVGVLLPSPSFIFFKNSYLLILRERERGISLCCSTYLRIHWLILVRARDQTCSYPSVSCIDQNNTNQLSYLARAYRFPLKDRALQFPRGPGSYRLGRTRSSRSEGIACTVPEVFMDFLKIYFIYLLLERGREKEERNINVWLPLVRPLLGIWPAAQACVLIGNQTCDPLVCRPALSPLSHTSQGSVLFMSCLSTALVPVVIHHLCVFSFWFVM